MLSRRYIQQVARLEAQTPGEDSFSPRWHEKNPVPMEGSALEGPPTKRVKAGQKMLRLRYMFLANGGMVIAHADSELPDGASWAEDE